MSNVPHRNTSPQEDITSGKILEVSGIVIACLAAISMVFYGLEGLLLGIVIGAPGIMMFFAGREAVRMGEKRLSERSNTHQNFHNAERKPTDPQKAEISKSQTVFQEKSKRRVVGVYEYTDHPLQFHVVKSSNISRIGYDESNKILVVEFKSSGTYVYYDIPKYVFVELLNSESCGRYFNNNISGNYQYERVK